MHLWPLIYRLLLGISWLALAIAATFMLIMFTDVIEDGRLIGGTAWGPVSPFDLFVNFVLSILPPFAVVLILHHPKVRRWFHSEARGAR